MSLDRPRRQGGRRSGLRLSNRPGVMILVTSEGGATCEGFLTIGVWTFVWTFTRVDAAVPRKRARIAEWLQGNSVKTVLKHVKKGYWEILTLPQRSHM